MTTGSGFGVLPFGGGEWGTESFTDGNVTASFDAVAQSARKLLLRFSVPMTGDAAFLNPSSYTIVGVAGAGPAVASVSPRGNAGAEIILNSDLTPFALYSLKISARLNTSEGVEVVFPHRATLRWLRTVPRPIRLQISDFSGETTGGLLGTPAGQVFLSPALDIAASSSSVEVERVSVCTRAFEVYARPEALTSTRPRLFTFPASAAGTSALLGTAGGVLWTTAQQLGLPALALADLRRDEVPGFTDEAAQGLLVEPIDITRASFLNDDRWRTFAGTGASMGVFRTADNLTPIGAGPTTGPFAIG